MRKFLAVLKWMNVITFRNRVVLFFSVLMPTISLVLFGYIFGHYNVSLSAGSQSSYANWLLPGVIVLNMMATGLMGNSSAMIAWRERGIFRRILVTPMPVWQVMLARVLTQITVIVVQAIVAIIVGVLLFHFDFRISIVPLTLVFLIIGALVFLSFGQVIASYVNRVEIGQIISQGIDIILTFLTGVLLPLQILPNAVAKVAAYTPSYFAADLLRSAMLSQSLGSSTLKDLVGLTIYFAAALMISAVSFRLEPMKDWTKRGSRKAEIATESTFPV
jgi:ABC-2 type transport system permease protein